MASGRWYIAFPSGPFRFSTRIACNRYFRSRAVCACRGFPRTCARGCTRMNARDLYTFTCARAYTCHERVSGFSSWHVPSTLTIQGQLLWKHSPTRVVHYIPGSISTPDILFCREILGFETALANRRGRSKSSPVIMALIRTHSPAILSHTDQF